MKPIAIQPRPGSFSDRWIEYCRERALPFRLVDCYSHEVIATLRECSALLWHIGHGIPADLLMGRHVLDAAEVMGLRVFPNWATQWHFDDKIAQKYLLESVGAPLVPTYAFFSRAAAGEWIRQASFPKVFKLRRGSGSRNVRLVRGAREAHALVRQAFRQGFKASGPVVDSVSAWKVRQARRSGSLLELIKSVPGRLWLRWQRDRLMGRERGYAYFQEFIPGNEFDTRVTVIGSRAFAFRRRVRPGDFRASGSGQIVHERSEIRPDCLRIAFEVAAGLKSQSTAFDFVIGRDGGPLIVEISFGYAARPVYDCGGFWDRELRWHDLPTWPQDAILEDLVSEVAG